MLQEEHMKYLAKLTVAVFVVLLSLSPVQAKKTRPTGLTPKLLGELSQSLKMDSHLTFARNALADHDAAKLTLNRDLINSIDDHFSHRIKDMSITNQERSGRCWMFAGLNILRPIAAKKLGIKDIEFSENYLFFYDKLEKANMFLEAVMKTRSLPMDNRYIEFLMNHTTPDGGYWVGLAQLVKKYGVVPKSVMPETYASSHSATINRTLDLKLKEYALKIRAEKDVDKQMALKIRGLKDVYRILAVNFGVPPKTFRWRYKDKDKKLTAYKTYTPVQFYTDVIGAPLDDYITLESIPTREFGKLYQIDLDKSVYDRPNLTFANVDVNVLRQVAVKSVLADTPVWFGCDVGKESTGKDAIMAPGIYDMASLYGMDFNLTRKQMFETYTDAPTHAMVFTGVDMSENRPVKWLVENSWGKKFGHNGFYYMADNWFDYYVQVVVVKKEFVPKDVLKIFKQKATLLPPWDPMYKVLTLGK